MISQVITYAEKQPWNFSLLKSYPSIYVNTVVHFSKMAVPSKIAQYVTVNQSEL
jgi:hypothetical protein